MPDCFRGQAYIASPYIVLDVTAERWPVVFLGYELTCFLDTKVACQQIVVMPTNKFCSDDFRDVEKALVVQHAIDVVLAFRVFRPGLPGLLVFGLQLLQPQSHALNDIGSFLGQLFL